MRLHDSATKAECHTFCSFLFNLEDPVKVGRDSINGQKKLIVEVSN